MPSSSDLTAYGDIRAVFDQAIEHGFPLTYRLRTANAATRWRFRAYNFRKKTRVELYKTIVLRIDEKIDPCTVILEQEALGVLTDSKGNVLELEPRVIDSAAELEIMRLRKELGIDK